MYVYIYIYIYIYAHIITYIILWSYCLRKTLLGERRQRVGEARGAIWRHVRGTRWHEVSCNLGMVVLSFSSVSRFTVLPFCHHARSVPFPAFCFAVSANAPFVENSVLRSPFLRFGGHAKAYYKPGYYKPARSRRLWASREAYGMETTQTNKQQNAKACGTRRRPSSRPGTSSSRTLTRQYFIIVLVSCVIL